VGQHVAAHPAPSAFDSPPSAAARPRRQR
jgi:hypothetical protein